MSAAKLKADGESVIVGPIEKMSKSKNNGVDPQSMIERYGADTVRLFMIETAPPDQSLEWSDTGVEGAARFVRRLWRTAYEHAQHPQQQRGLKASEIEELSADESALRRKIHETIAKVSDDVGRRYKFNTAVAACRELINALPDNVESAKTWAVCDEAMRTVVLLLAPVIPHICHVLWHELGGEGDVIDAPWPQSDPQAMIRDSIELVVQVNGKLRGKISVPADSSRDAIEQAAVADPLVAKFVEQKSIRRVVVVPGKLVNVVV